MGYTQSTANNSSTCSAIYTLMIVASFTAVMTMLAALSGQPLVLEPTAIETLEGCIFIFISYDDN